MQNLLKSGGSNARHCDNLITIHTLINWRTSTQVVSTQFTNTLSTCRKKSMFCCYLVGAGQFAASEWEWENGQHCAAAINWPRGSNQPQMTASPTRTADLTCAGRWQLLCCCCLCWGQAMQLTHNWTSLCFLALGKEALRSVCFQLYACLYM